jgi:hypothetical protein
MPGTFDVFIPCIQAEISAIDSSGLSLRAVFGAAIQSPSPSQKPILEKLQ